MNKFVLAILLFVVGHTAHAQEHIQVIGNADLDSLVLQNKAANELAEGIHGYRVQIFFGTDRKIANEIRTNFLQLYPEVEAYLVYQQPYFKVRIGDFRTQLESQAIYQNLLIHFDKVFIVPDKINLPKL
jgi:hypothetical protein